MALEKTLAAAEEACEARDRDEDEDDIASGCKCTGAECVLLCVKNDLIRCNTRQTDLRDVEKSYYRQK